MNVGQEVQELVLASAAAAGPLPVEGARFQLGPKAGGALVVRATAILTTFKLEGRITPLAPWVDVTAANATFVAAGGQVLVPIAQTLPEMRLSWSGNAGLVSAWVMA